MALLIGMNMDLEFDKPITSKHYISPGGYEVSSKGNYYGFDFFESVGIKSKNNPRLIHYEIENLDKQAFPESIYLYDKFWKSGNYEFSEFYVYTGEYDEPELYLKEVKSVTMIFDDGECFNIPEEKLLKIKEELLCKK